MAQLQLHAIEDAARYADDNELFELSRQYARWLNEEWKKPLKGYDCHYHDNRRPHYATGPNYFRPQTILRNLANEIEYVALYYDAEKAENFAQLGFKDRQRKPKGDLPTLARKAVSAARKVRPDLFEDAA